MNGQMRIDTLAYRLIWRLKRMFYRIPDQCGPIPLRIRNEPCRHYEPPHGLVQTMHNNNKFARICMELQILPRLSDYLPEKLTEEDWHELLRTKNAKERFEYLRFLNQREKKRAKEALLKKPKWRNGKEEEDDEEEEGGEEGEENEQERTEEGEEGHRCRLMFTPQLAKEQRYAACHRYIRSVQLTETPQVAVDCRFLPLHSRRGLALTLKQINMLVGSNRDRQWPWPVHLANFPIDAPHLEHKLRKHLHFLDGKMFIGESSPLSYLELFPELRENQRIVYLSPHASEQLERVEADTCYVIGAIVDRVYEPRIGCKASLETALVERVPCRCLPIGPELLRGGNPMLTMDQVLAILQHVFDSPRGDDWAGAFERYIPIRKLRAPTEKNPIMRLRYENIRKRNQEILWILEEMVTRKQSLMNTESSDRESTYL